VEAKVSHAAIYEISILDKAGVRFGSGGLRGNKIPGADIRGGEFSCAKT
jgi:hypothetical protein